MRFRTKYTKKEKFITSIGKEPSKTDQSDLEHTFIGRLLNEHQLQNRQMPELHYSQYGDMTELDPESARQLEADLKNTWSLMSNPEKNQYNHQMGEFVEQTTNSMIQQYIAENTPVEPALEPIDRDWETH